MANLPRLDNSTRESYLLSIRSDQADTIERRFSVREFGKVEFPYSAELKHNTGAEMDKPLLHKALTIFLTYLANREIAGEHMTTAVVTPGHLPL